MITPPQLLFIAGPNGAGKSTFSKDLSPSGALIFDPDKEKAIIELKFINLPQENINYAFQQHFQDFVELALSLKQDFVIETNFRDHALLDIAARFKANGYDTNMIYLVLRSVAESADRVTYRVNNGGHFIDDESILYNYTEGLKTLDYFADRFDHLEIIDASGYQLQLRSLLSIQKQQLVYLSTDLPKGTEETIKRIAGRYHSRGMDDDEERDWTHVPRR